MTGWRTLLLLTAVAVAPARAAAETPAWVREVLAVAAPSDPAVVLLDEAVMTIAADGRIRTTRRYAVRVNDRAGRDAARLREVYVTGTGKVRRMRAWLIRGSAAVRTFGDRETVDAALVNNDVFNEVRVRAVGAVDETSPGDVFAAESDTEDRLLFGQFEWTLQERWRVLQARRILALPPGWQADAMTFNRAPLDARVEAGRMVWEARDLAPVAVEASMPPLSRLVPRLAISLSSTGVPVPGQFAAWTDVSAWLHRLSEPAAPPESLTRKAVELTAGARSDFERIEAIGRFAQRVQYVSIQTGLGRGGGYQPRPPALVLERNYGDCKDKANLMRALLAAVGIRSYLVSIFAGDRQYVRKEWPSPQQFNHMILAIAVTEVPERASSVVRHPDLGPLLMFDPTDDRTPVGELPLHEQGSLALVVLPEDGGLMRMPVTSAAQHRITRRIEGQLDEAGGLATAVHETASGVFGAAERALYARREGVSYETALARRAAARIPRAIVNRVAAPSADAAAGPFSISFELNAAAFARVQPPLMLVTLPFEERVAIELRAVASRRTPVDLDPASVVEDVLLDLPPGWAIDEVPPDVTLDGPFGRYRLSFDATPGRITARRELDVALRIVEADEYGAARAFFDAVRAADATPVVLIQR